MTINISMQDMLKAGVHFGHSTRYWNPQMRQYIFGVRQKLHIINLEHSLPMFRDALEFVASIASKRGRVLFVGTKFAARDIVKEEAIRCGMPYVNHRWLGGMLTNYKTIRQSIKRLKDLEATVEDQDTIKSMTKKELLTLMREKDKLSATLGGIKNMGGIPEAIFVIDVSQEYIAVKEANRLGIPVIGVVDSNSSPEGVDYIVPGNDDAQRSIRLYCKSVADTVIEARGVLTLTPAAAKEAQAAKKVQTKKDVVKAVSQAAVKVQHDAKAEGSVPAVKKNVAVKRVVAKDAVEEKKSAKKPAAKKPAAKKPTIKKTAAKTPVAKKSAAKKPATKTTVAKKKVAAKKESAVDDASKD